MKNSAWLKITFALVLLVLSFSMVQAAYVQQGNYYTDNSTNIQVTLIDMNNDFIFKSPYSGFEVCRCGTISDTVEIMNTGAYNSMFTLDSNKDYVTFAQNHFEVESGKTLSVPVYINLPCDSGWKETIELSATSSFAKTKVFEQTININDCQNLVAGLYESQLEEKVCEPFTTSFRIENTGAFNEVYHIDLEPFEEYVTFSSEDLLIAAGRAGEVFVHYALPCDVYGQHDLTYTITAQKNDMKVKLVQNLFIPQDYDFTVAVPQSLSMCDRTQAQYSAVIQNNNNFTDTYTVVVTKPTFVDVAYPIVQDEETRTFDLIAGGQVSIPFTVDFPAKKFSGDHNITLEVISENGDITKEVITNLDVLNCVDLTSHLFTADGDLNLCGGDDTTINFNVENLGVTPEAYLDFVLIDPSTYLSLSEVNTFVYGPESFDISLDVDVPRSVNESAEYYSHIDTYFNYGVENENAFNVYVNPAEQCYSITPTKSKITKYYEVESFVATIENEGLRKASYDVRLIGAPDYLSIAEDEITLELDQKVSVTFLVNQSILQNMTNGSSILPEAFTSEPKLVFIHDDSNTVMAYDLSINLATSHPWYINALDAVKAASICTIAFFVLAAIAFAYLMTFIIRLALGRSWKGRKLLGVLLLAVIVISGLVIAGTSGLPTRDAFYTSYDLDTNSTRHILLEEDKKLELDMNEMFFDADDDIVEFGIISIDPMALQYEIEGSELELVSVQDYNGISILELYATDAYNETAFSEEITVEVLPIEDYSTVELFDLACPFVNWIMLVLACAFVWLAYSLRKQSQPKNKVEKVARGSYPEPVKKVAAKKVTKKAVTKKVAKKTTKKVTKKAAKKSTKKVAKKTAKKATKKVTKKAKK